MERVKQLHWPLIIGLGALAFLHPFMNLSGLMDGIGRPAGPIAVTVLISAIWLVIVVAVRARQPLLTLTCTGVVHGIFAFAIGSLLAPLLTGKMFIPYTSPFVLPFALTGILVTNALWGLLVGLVAWAVQQARASRRRGFLVADASE